MTPTVARPDYEAVRLRHRYALPDDGRALRRLLGSSIVESAIARPPA